LIPASDVKVTSKSLFLYYHKHGSVQRDVITTEMFIARLDHRFFVMHLVYRQDCYSNLGQGPMARLLCM